jgi:tetratricopeptide (TPR) repeat protein
MGESLYAFSGIDYEFEDFPASLNAKEGSTITKTKVTVQPVSAPVFRKNVMMNAIGDPRRRDDYAKRVLQFDPDNGFFVAWLGLTLDPEEASAFFHSRIADRPIRVEWHRGYQAAMERAHPETDLRPEYQKLVAETKEHADALYLLGRVEPDEKESDKLYQRAAEANPPCPYAFYGLGYRSLAQGRFPESVHLLEQAYKLMPNNILVQSLLAECLIAKGDYDRDIEFLEGLRKQPGMNLAWHMHIIHAAILKGDLDRVNAATAEVTQAYVHAPAAERATTTAWLELEKPCCAKDVKAYLKIVAEHPDWVSFESLMLQNKIEEAIQKIGKKEMGVLAYRHALVYLAAAKKGDAKLADSHWDAFLEALSKEGKDERKLAEVLSGRKPFDADAARKVNIDPAAKRVFLAAAAKHNPAEGAELLELARKLDFHRDGVSLCLQELLK